jgi:hypothetical protein
MERSRSEIDADIVSEQVASGFQESPVLARIWAGPARALYVGPGLDLAPHLNVATTIAVSLRQPFDLRTWAKSAGWSPWRSEVISVIPSETLHHLKSLGPMAFLYLDPLTDRRHALSNAVLMRGRERLRLAAPHIGLDEAFAVFGLRPQSPRDARIARVVREIERRPNAFRCDPRRRPGIAPRADRSDRSRGDSFPEDFSGSLARADRYGRGAPGLGVRRRWPPAVWHPDASERRSMGGTDRL